MQEFAAVRWAARNWFLLALPMLALASLQFVGAIDWQRDGRIAERVVLFDWCISVPFLYFLCYRTTLPARQMAMRLIALACFCVWFAAWVVPQAFQSLLPQLGWARMAGLAVIVVVELRLIVAAIRIAFSNNGTTEHLVRATGVPPLIAKLMMLEAKFWRAVWRLVRGR